MTRRQIARLACVCGMAPIVFACAGPASRGPVFEGTRESLIQYGVPQWYQDAKFGVYMHWGPFSVAAYKTEWYPRHMYIEGTDFNKHHIETWGPLDKFGYKDFIPMLTAEKWDPDAYARLFKESGAQYVAAPAIHHDGFAMWDSEIIPYNSQDMGPRRDVVGETIAAARKVGLKAGLSTHYGRHWLYYTFRPEYDNWDPKYEGLYGKRRGDKDPPSPEDAEHWKSVMIELIDNYQPDYIFVDGGVIDAEAKFDKPYFRPAMYDVVAHYYNRGREWGKGVVLSYKRAFMMPDEAVEDFERAGIDAIRDSKWQSDDKVSKVGWCYVEETDFWPMEHMLGNFLDIVSKNGNLLLSIGPKPDGTIRQEEVDALKAFGAWLKVNGEAIYGSRPWRVFGEDPKKPAPPPEPEARKGKKPKKKGGSTPGPGSVRFTRQDDALYATVFGWPESGRFTITSIASAEAVADGGIKSVSMLGSKERIDWRFTDEGLEVGFPSRKPCDYAWVFRIAPKGKLKTEE